MMEDESCDHLGSRGAPGPFVICSGGPPASNLTHTCRQPVESLTNATYFPSGENDGLSSSPSKSVSRRNVTASGARSVRPHIHHAHAPASAIVSSASTQRSGRALVPTFNGADAPVLGPETEVVDSRW